MSRKKRQANFPHRIGEKSFIPSLVPRWGDGRKGRGYRKCRGGRHKGRKKSGGNVRKRERRIWLKSTRYTRIKGQDLNTKKKRDPEERGN